MYTEYPYNIIDNSDFEICITDPWMLTCWSGAAATFELVGGACKVTPTHITDEPYPWHIQLMQELSGGQINRLEVGETYIVSFDAVAEAGDRSGYVYFGQNENPFTALIDQSFTAGTVKETFSYEFEVTEAFSSMKLSLSIGNDMPAVTFDNVRISRKITDSDNDGYADEDDNCPITYNPSQDDSDNDNVGNACDNCVHTPNSNQADSDGDGIGDACETTPVESPLPDLQTLIFPNPSAGTIHIRFGNEFQGETSIEIRDMRGRLVYLNRVSAEPQFSVSIDISAFEESIYFIRLSNIGTNLVSKLVKTE